MYYKVIQNPMRTITTISLPAAVAREVKKEAKEQGFAFDQ